VNELLHDFLLSGISIPRSNVAMVAGTVPLSLELVKVTLKLTGACSVVTHAGGWDKSDIGGPSGHEERITTLATLVVLTAEQRGVDGPWKCI